MAAAAAVAGAAAVAAAAVGLLPVGFCWSMVRRSGVGLGEARGKDAIKFFCPATAAVRRGRGIYGVCGICFGGSSSAALLSAVSDDRSGRVVAAMVAGLPPIF